MPFPILPDALAHVVMLRTERIRHELDLLDEAAELAPADVAAWVAAIARTGRDLADLLDRAATEHVGTLWCQHCGDFLSEPTAHVCPITCVVCGDEMEPDHLPEHIDSAHQAVGQ